MGTVLSPSGNSTSSIVIGTPGYMPSEKLAGRPIFASDLYALALTMIYGLTSKISSEFPIDPLTGKIGRLQDTLVSPSLGNVLDRAIATYPQERFATAGMMLQALQGQSSPAATTILADDNFNQKPAKTIIDDNPIYHQNFTVIQPSNNGRNNNSLMGVIIALLILIGFGGLGYFMYQQNQLYQVQISQIEAERQKAKKEDLVK